MYTVLHTGDDTKRADKHAYPLDSKSTRHWNAQLLCTMLYMHDFKCDQCTIAVTEIVINDG